MKVNVVITPDSKIHKVFAFRSDADECASTMNGCTVQEWYIENTVTCYEQCDELWEVGVDIDTDTIVCGPMLLIHCTTEPFVDIVENTIWAYGETPDEAIQRAHEARISMSKRSGIGVDK